MTLVRPFIPTFQSKTLETVSIGNETLRLPEYKGAPGKSRVPDEKSLQTPEFVPRGVSADRAYLQVHTPSNTSLIFDQKTPSAVRTYRQVADANADFRLIDTFV